MAYGALYDHDIKSCLAEINQNNLCCCKDIEVGVGDQVTTGDLEMVLMPWMMMVMVITIVMIMVVILMMLTVMIIFDTHQIFRRNGREKAILSSRQSIAKAQAIGAEK